MAIELPGPVADFLNFIGISWPNINEDTVREFGEHISEFAHNLQSTHQGATDTISQLGQAYQGESYEKLFTTWGQMSETHMNELLAACDVLSTGLGVAADVIIGEKLAAIAQLVVLVAEFIADQAAAVATFGLAEAALALIEEEGQQVVKFLEQEIENYIVGQVINAAAGPLIDKVAQAVSGLVYEGVASALGESGSGAGGAGGAISIHPEQVAGHVQTLRAHAGSAQSNGAQFASTAEGLSFE